ncbi:hypothetical protein MCAG_04313 [Micromonospora sp. ATCC 39149]|uniref:DUF4352 domain-containing protein n=1 Tax=Micromonospora carbonacea TaxID=47853 RepID=A0A7D6CDL9_9ACTN|nr:hypothetical protein [Micromonospora sp. ATCC 39149]EEP73986.1 hypothetical protein MCAG_04313 [Micromonospora sp. ATCC 39149]QLJ99863.1 hypothetical protein HZU44_07160 [Micromonospora carbonacea]
MSTYQFARRGRATSAKRRKIVVATAFALAAAALIPLMNRTNASAATPDEVSLHCRDGSPLLENCTFIQRREATAGGNSFRVSEVQNNCDGTVPDPFSLAVSVRSTTEVQLENGAFFNVSGTPSLLEAIGATATSVKNRFKILGFGEDSAVTVTIRADVEPGQRAAIYFRPEVVESGGYLEAEYKQAQDGTKVFFFPEQNADTVLVRFPLANDNGDPKGFYWIRSMPCRENSRLVIPGFDTADFGGLDGAFGITDTPVAAG